MSRVGRGNIVLTPEQVEQLRYLAEQGTPRLKLASLYNVSVGTIFRVIHKLGAYK